MVTRASRGESGACAPLSTASGLGRRARDAALLVALLLCATKFLFVQWRWNEAPGAAESIEFLACGADYEADRFRDGVGAPGWCMPIVREWAARLPAGTCVAVDGPWVLQRTARYALYPRRVFNHVRVDEAGALGRSGADAACVWPLERGAALRGDARLEDLGAGVFLLKEGAGTKEATPPPPPSPEGEGSAMEGAGIPWATLARIAAALLAILFMGQAIARLSFPGADLGTAFLLGALAVAVESLFLTWARVPLSVFADLALSAAAISILLLRPRPQTPAAPTSPGGSLDRALAPPLLALLALQVAVAALLALGRAPTSGDDLAEWALKGKHYFAVAAIALPGPPYEGAFLFRSYPPLVPAILAFVYRAAGAAADGPAKLVFTAFLAAGLGALHAGLRRAGLARWHALAATALVAISGNELVNEAGYAWADLPLAAFGVASAAALMRGSFTLGGLLAGAGALTKLEGFPAGLALVFFGACAARSARPAMAFLAVAALWIAHCAAHGIGASSEHVAAFAPARIAAVLPLVARALVSEYRFEHAFPIVAVGLAIGLSRRFPARSWIPAGVFFAELALIFAAYVVTSYDGEALLKQVDYTAPRLLLHALPVGMLAAAAGAFAPPLRLEDPAEISGERVADDPDPRRFGG